MTRSWRWVFLLALPGVVCPFTAPGQIDPVKRELFQFGYNAALEGHSPLSAYAFYYWNQPEFLRTNLTLRLAVAPTYLDSELGIRHAVSENTDLGVGMAGGAFADNYEEIHGGTFYPSQSFTGYGAETSLSLYHLFNPGQTIPLNGLVRGIVHYSTYERDDATAGNFQLPKDHGTFSVRTGLRWGGREPTLFPALAMEISGWYEGEFRTGTGTYGYGDRSVVPASHLFWGEALLAYTLPELKHSFYLSLTAGTSINADRFSAYRLGSVLPLVSEFPLSLPGYYYQEISAQEFVLAGGNYMIPLDKKQRWNLSATASTACGGLPARHRAARQLEYRRGRRHSLQIAVVENHARIRLWRGCHPVARPRRAERRCAAPIRPWTSPGGPAQPRTAQPLARLPATL